MQKRNHMFNKTQKGSMTRLEAVRQIFEESPDITNAEGAAKVKERFNMTLSSGGYSCYKSLIIRANKMVGILKKETEKEISLNELITLKERLTQQGGVKQFASKLQEVESEAEKVGGFDNLVKMMDMLGRLS